MKLDRILNALTGLKITTEKILMDEQVVKDLLTKIDSATTAIGNNVNQESANLSIIGGVIGTISSEVGDLQAALAAALANGTGVSQALVDQATALQTKADAASTAIQASTDALAGLVPVLNGIATSAQVPVPVPVPPPSPAPVV